MLFALWCCFVLNWYTFLCHFVICCVCLCCYMFFRVVFNWYMLFCGVLCHFVMCCCVCINICCLLLLCVVLYHFVMGCVTLCYYILCCNILWYVVLHYLVLYCILQFLLNVKSNSVLSFRFNSFLRVISTLRRLNYSSESKLNNSSVV